MAKKQNIDRELSEFDRQAAQRDGVINFIVDALGDVVHAHRPRTPFDTGKKSNTFLQSDVVMALASTSTGAVIGEVLKAAEQAGVLRASSSGRFQVLNVDPLYDGGLQKALASIRHS